MFKSNTLDRDKKKKKKFSLFNKGGDKKDVQSGEESENDLESFEPVPYELVVDHRSKSTSFHEEIHHFGFFASRLCTARHHLWSI